ncbi:cobalt ABC transporter, inner membrane subunit CbiQ [Ammonifex degensii KC4]|uniref:Cobalt ABC transporter, inner membrane subunit CbiQ n=1 Tax=Ammonifex degensii (strain DSM 10501 / KC4) TaxID=429009 RepID=C9R9R1_AMMDK|nr:cobalt ECF transporter T component CbiQ [Ammonifex degensii]ACX53040.1 cobalt ABC transporter, inner membrane subunit CbiQ [Ammonifex degensii KC4]
MSTKPVPRCRGTGFIEKNLQELHRIFADELFATTMARRPGLYQSLDPRTKVVATVAFIGVVGLVHHLTTLVLLNLLALAVALLSRLPLKLYLARVWLFIPLFTGAMTFPAIFNWITPGEPICTLIPEVSFRLGSYHFQAPLAITVQGLQGAATIVLRAADSVSWVILLTLTTPWPQLLKALRVFRVPQLFVLILEMTLRYIFLLLQLSVETFEAYRFRLVGPPPAREKRRFIASLIGNVLVRTQALSEEVYQAMQARGYTGEPRVLIPYRFGRADLVFGLALLILLAALLYLDRRLL